MRLQDRLAEAKKPTSTDYANAANFRWILKKSASLTLQQKRTLWGQAVHGDLDGAMKGYAKLMGREDK